MDLVALELGQLQVRGGDNDPAGLVNFQRHFEALFRRVPEDSVQHKHDIIVAVVVIVEQDHVVRRQTPRLLLALLLRLRRRARHSVAG